MKKSTSFQDLLVWQKAHQLVVNVYSLTKGFPADERFGLISQMRRAAVSVPVNIAEGFRRQGKADKVRFFNISQGSLEELRYYLLLAKDLHYQADQDDLIPLLVEVSKMLDAYIKAILTSDFYLLEEL